MKHAVLILIAALCIFSMGIYVKVSNFKECKAHGFSTMYCLFTR